ncbi:MAG: ferric reductase-like transmembrane domain-containing protein [Nocardioidaceae bacterium]
MSALTDGPLLWYLNRSTGVTLMVLLTLTTALGILSAREGRRRLVPGIVTQGLHRNLALFSLVLLLAHVATAVTDTFVDIRWWQAVSPVGATYKPFWLGAGSLALDVMLLIVVTSLLRDRIPHRLWRAVHWLSYLAWASAMVHGAGIGTDQPTAWGRWTGIGCLAAVAAAAALRVVADARATRDPSLASAAVR